MKSTKELTSAQKWERATLADNFIFCKVMTANPDLCKEVLEKMLGMEIDRIEQPRADHSLKSDYGLNGIRFDVYVKDGTGRCLDVEVQTANRRDLARRARGYLGLMDVDSSPCDVDYDDLKDSYVIFLCLDDPFGRGLPVYTFETVCVGDKSISLGDGTHRIFYNAAKHAVMPNETLKSFFCFLAGAADGSALSDRLATMVEYAKSNAQWKLQFMAWEDEIKFRAKEVCEESAVETARKLLGMGKLSEQDIAEATGLPLAQVEQLRQESSTVKA